MDMSMPMATPFHIVTPTRTVTPTDIAMNTIQPLRMLTCTVCISIYWLILWVVLV
jgi:hypothetical protein